LRLQKYNFFQSVKHFWKNFSFFLKKPTFFKKKAFSD